MAKATKVEITNPAIDAIHAIGKSLTALAKDATYSEDIRKDLQNLAVRSHRIAEKVKRGTQQDARKAERLAKMQARVKKLQEQLKALEAE